MMEKSPGSSPAGYIRFPLGIPKKRAIPETMDDGSLAWLVVWAGPGDASTFLPLAPQHGPGLSQATSPGLSGTVGTVRQSDKTRLYRQGCPPTEFHVFNAILVILIDFACFLAC